MGVWVKEPKLEELTIRIVLYIFIRSESGGTGRRAGFRIQY